MSILKKILDKSKNNKNIIFRDENYSYNKFYEDTISLYSSLKNFNTPRKVLAICSNYSKDYLTLIFAAYKANFLIVFINPNSAQEEKLFIIKNSGANLVFSEQKIFNKKFRKINNFYAYSFNNYQKLKKKGDRFLIYTSGTTGKPKGVIITDSSITSNIYSISKDLKLKKKIYINNF